MDDGSSNLIKRLSNLPVSSSRVSPKKKENIRSGLV
jgi:hypothetical protein